MSFFNQELCKHDDIFCYSLKNQQCLMLPNNHHNLLRCHIVIK